MSFLFESTQPVGWSKPPFGLVALKSMRMVLWTVMVWVQLGEC